MVHNFLIGFVSFLVGLVGGMTLESIGHNIIATEISKLKLDLQYELQKLKGKL